MGASGTGSTQVEGLLRPKLPSCSMGLSSELAGASLPVRPEANGTPYARSWVSAGGSEVAGAPLLTIREFKPVDMGALGGSRGFWVKRGRTDEVLRKASEMALVFAPATADSPAAQDMS